MTEQQCNTCPHQCGAFRHLTPHGYCRTGVLPSIAAICRHTGEEPPVNGKRGICNVFFTHCNMQCIYCQNHQISRNTTAVHPHEMTVDMIVDEILRILPTCENTVGFVSPSHFIPQIIRIIDRLHARGKRPVTVYNSNGYDSVSSLLLLDGKIDIYLPDFKYSDPRLARTLSGVDHYPDTALAAIREMYRQKGSPLITRRSGTARSGLIIRHLILPGHIPQSLEVLRTIAREISTSVHLSLMSQYTPPFHISGHPELNRTLRPDEYSTVVDEYCRLGFHKGWLQSPDSTHNLLPDFSAVNPFWN